MTIAQPHGRIALMGGPLILPDRIASGQAVIVEGSRILGIIPAGELGALSQITEKGRISAWISGAHKIRPTSAAPTTAPLSSCWRIIRS